MNAAERLPLEVCQIAGIAEPLLCGTFTTFENRESQEGRTIPIRVVVVPAQSERLTSSAWIEHPGGPRYSTVGTAHYFAAGGWLESFRRTRDVVLVDVRGLHESGALFCDALKYPRYLERYYPPERVAACREELDKKADLRQYSTDNAIGDYEDIRQWLGYEQWDVGGWSFGSRFMLTYVHLHPTSIRSVSLLIPSILNFERPLHYAKFGQRAFDGLVAACKDEEACGRAFPTVETDLDTILARLEDDPLRVDVKNPNSGESTSRSVTRDIFAEEIWASLLDNAVARQLPYVMHHAARGNFDPFLDLAVPKSPQTQEPEGHYLSVVCPEETGRLDQRRVDVAAKDTFVGTYTAKDYMQACEAWGLPLNRLHPITPGVFDIPALIITGALDPATPPEYGARNAQHFVNALHITVDEMSHGESGMRNSACLGDILDRFVTAGTTAGLDTGCVESMQPPPFRLNE